MDITEEMKQNPASILWITGGEDVMRYVYDHHSFGYWTAAFDTILEKHGWLDFEKADPSVLENPELLRKYHMLIISWLPSRFWRPSYVRSLRSYDGLIFMEGPYPRFAESFLGIERISSQPNIQEGKLLFTQPEIRRHVESKFQRTLFQKTESIDLAPKQVLTKAPELARQELNADKGNGYRERLRNLVLSYMLAYRNRFESQGQFFPNPGYDALAALALVRFVGKLGAGPYQERFQDLLNKVLDSSNALDLSVNDDKEVVAKATWGVTFSKAYELLGESSYKEKAETIGEEFAQLASGKSKQPPIVKGWVANALASTSKLQAESGRGALISEQFSSLAKSLPKNNAPATATLLWLTLTAAEDIGQNNGKTSEEAVKLATNYISNISPIKENELPKQMSNWRLWDALLLGAVAEKSNDHSTGESIFGICLDQGFDEEKGSFRNAKVVNGKLQSEAGYLSMPWLVIALMEAVPSFDIEDGPAEALKAYDSGQINSWGNTPYWVDQYRTVGASDEIPLQVDSGEIAGIFRRGRIIGSTFQVLSYLTHFHTMQPLKEALLDCPSRHEMVLENLLFFLLENQLRRYGQCALKVHAWPWDKKYALTIRHDVDRIPVPEQFDRLLKFEQDEQLGVSWYWIPGRFNDDYMRRVEESKHEVGLHAMKLTKKGQEIGEVQERLTYDGKVVGEAWHGGGGGDYWIGHPSVKAAVNEGLLYTEFVPTIYDYPYGKFPALDSDGNISSESIVGITHTVSTDVSPRKGKAIYRLEWVQELAQNGYYGLLLNHPDVNFDELKTWDELLPKEGRLDWSCQQVAGWWRSTHDKHHLQVEKLEDSTEKLVYQLICSEDVTDLELRLPLREDAVSDVRISEGEQTIEAEWKCSEEDDGHNVRIRINLNANSPIKITITRKRMPRYEEVFDKVPGDAQGPNVQPDYHVSRVTNMIEVINRFTPFRDLNGPFKVADIGCGYGPFTVAIHAIEQPQKSIGLDITPRYMQIANDLVKNLQMEGISFYESDMVRTSEFVQDADIVIVNNSINFLTTRTLYKQAMDSYYRALKPGGALVILTPNRLFKREAFTQLIGVQFMPKSVANWYVKYRKKRETYADIRLPSPFELRRWANRSGFGKVEVIDAYTRLAENWRRYFKPRFYLVAVK